MGRPRGFAEEQAVAAAAELFARRSYDGTSVDDLVSQTGVHRGSLYKTFGSKRGLYLAALRHHVDHEVPRLAAVLASSGLVAAAGASAPVAPGSAAPDAVVPGSVAPEAAAAAGGFGFLFLAAAERAAVDEDVAAEVGRALDLLDAAVRATPEALARDVTAALLGLMLRGRAQPGRATGEALAARLPPHSDAGAPETAGPTVGRGRTDTRTGG